MSLDISSKNVCSDKDEELIKKLNEISGEDRTEEFETYQYLVKAGK